MIASLRHPSITRIAVDDQARGLAIFGLSQLLGTSGFLVTYLAAVVTGAAQYRARQQVEHFFEGMAWLAQIVVFVMLGLLVTPHELPPYLVGAVIGAAVLILLARPVAVFACLLPFGFTLRETAFASWVGLRGAVPIYLRIIPALADPRRDQRLFASIFTLASGTNSESSSSRLGISSAVRMVNPVRLPPGRAKLATRPFSTGSVPVSKTIGIVKVAVFAANAGEVPPLVAITSTLRPTRSAAKAGSRS